jgi:uncharacterized delta-60 repeat protein
LPPAITTNPSNRTVVVATAATFSVTANGNAPLQYFWRRNGTVINGATNSSYTLSSAQLSDSGAQFSCLVSNAYGTAVSANAILTVQPAPAPEIDVFVDGVSLVDGASTVSFGTNQPGLVRTFIVTNSGAASLTLGGMNLLSDSADFPVNTAGMATNLAPGAATSFSVTFQPTMDGLRTAVLQLTNNDGNENPFDITLTGIRSRVDAGFNPDANGTVYGVAIQADGKILIAGDFSTIGGGTRNHIARLNADGSPDSSFNPNVDGSVFCIAAQSDGKILLGGDFGTVGGVPRSCIARLNPDGTVDSSFNPGADSLIFAMALQPDGKILLGGFFTVVGGAPRSYIARLNADGTLDNGFDPELDNDVNALTVQADGRILVAGDLTAVGGVPRSYIARLNADGSLDNSFMPDINSSVLSMALQADGKILLGGDFTAVGGGSHEHLARLNANGTVDNAFNPEADNWVYSVAVQADGRILIAGGFNVVSGTNRNYIARLNADGSLDAGFDPNANGLVYGIALQGDGGVVMGGDFSTVAGFQRHNAARFLNDPAAQSLVVSNAARVQWLRGGSAPEVEQVTFELSTNGGSNWAALGSGTRINGGWERTGLSLAPSGQIRARGRAVGGMGDGCSSLIQQVAAFSPPDTTPPSISCPPNMMVSADAGQCHASGVVLGSPVATDDSGTTMVTNNAPALFPIGTNIVTWVVYDPSGNSNTCSQLVIVRDTEPPTIACPADVAVNTDFGQPFAAGVVLGTPLVSDNCTIAFVTNNASAQFPIGTNSVRWAVFDTAGNSNACTQLVIVRDVQAPSLACPADVAVNADAGQCHASGVVLGTPVASDNSGNVFVTNNAPALFPVGTNSVTWTAYDPAGNISVCFQTVIVRDSNPPVILAAPASQTNWAGTTASFTVNATACTPLNYAWIFGSTPIIGATNHALTLVNVQPSQSGTYAVIVSGAGGSVTNTAVLTVLWAPVLDAVQVLGGTGLQVSWPETYLGWELQVLTNQSLHGLGSDWFTVPGSTNNTQMILPIDPATPGVFYRLHSP